jgi:hypothetical protein
LLQKSFKRQRNLNRSLGGRNIVWNIGHDLHRHRIGYRIGHHLEHFERDIERRIFRVCSGGRVMLWT